MVSKKRQLEDSAPQPKSKKSKVSGDGKKSKTEKSTQPTSSIAPEEIDFPRGGGTSFTPIEVKAIRAEATKEADEELFKVRSQPCTYIYNTK